MNFKNAKYIALFALIAVLVLPKPAHAVFGIADVGVFDFFDSALGGIEELAGPVAKSLIQIFFGYVFSIIALYTSTTLLQTAATSPQWLSITNNPMVRSGWNFVAGIANMFIILILIWIALSFILEIDSAGMKKALPRLIVVAILINFSLVLVGGLVDISNILYNTLLKDNETLIFDVGDYLGLNMNSVLTGLMTWFVVLIGGFLIPFIAPFSQLALAISVVGSIIFLPQILTWIAQIFIASLLSGVFFVFTFLFGARVFIVQILAIISPLAFVASILPKTEGQWKEWFKHLTEWIFLGVSLFFLLIIGLRAANWLIPPDLGNTPMTIFGWYSLADYIKYYFFLFVYLVVVIYWVKSKAMPQFANTLIEQGTTLWGVMRKRALSPITKQTQRGIERQIARGAERWTGRFERWATKGTVLKPVGLLARRAITPALLRHKARVRAEETKLPDKFKEQTLEEQEKIAKAASTPQLRAALAAEMGGKFSKTSKEFQEQVTGEAVKLSKNADYKQYVEKIRENVADATTEDIELALAKNKEEERKVTDEIDTMRDEILNNDRLSLQIASDMKLVPAGSTNAEEAKRRLRESKELRNQLAAARNIRKAKTKAIANLANPTSVATIIGSHGWSSKGWQKYIDTFSSEDIDKVMNSLNTMVTNSDGRTLNRGAFQRFCENNPQTAKFLLYNNAGKELGWAAKEEDILTPEETQAITEEKARNKARQNRIRDWATAGRARRQQIPTPQQPIEDITANINNARRQLTERREELNAIPRTVRRGGRAGQNIQRTREANRQRLEGEIQRLEQTISSFEEERRPLLSSRPEPLPQIKRVGGRIPAQVRPYVAEGNRLIKDINTDIRRMEDLRNAQSKLESLEARRDRDIAEGGLDDRERARLRNEISQAENTIKSNLRAGETDPETAINALEERIAQNKTALRVARERIRVNRPRT